MATFCRALSKGDWPSKLGYLGVLLAVAVSCAGPPTGDPLMQTGGTDGGTNTPRRDPDSPRDDGLTCKGEEVLAVEQNITPRVMIVLDRSGSMLINAGGNHHETKWQATTTALLESVFPTDTRIEWGIKLFPSDEGCNATGLEIPVAPRNAEQIMQAVASYPPSTGVFGGKGSTPTTAALRNATAYMATLAAPNPRFLVLATDGEPNCRQCCVGPFCGDICNDEDEATKAVRAAADAGISTFVVGVATSSDEAAHMVLNQMAEAGGRPKPGGGYYAAQNRSELIDAMASIARVVACEAPLRRKPAQPSRLRVRSGDLILPRDGSHHNGWDLSPDGGTIRLFGETCAQLQRGELGQLQAVFDCTPVG